ncbi:MAG: major facilitator transporter [Glaciihabitans sp.]|nr:major facilitator transporter [Glaciihabitans sp.]
MSVVETPSNATGSNPTIAEQFSASPIVPEAQPPIRVDLGTGNGSTAVDPTTGSPVTAPPASTTVQPTPAAPHRPEILAGQRFTLSTTQAFVGAAVTFGAFYAAVAVPTPILVWRETHWGYASWVMIFAFAAYALGLLVALLVVGALSDYLGRRPVIVVALVVELGALLLFVFAPDVRWIILARVLQGLATGAATSAFAATLVDLSPERHPRLGVLFGGVIPAAGLATGVLLVGVAVEANDTVNSLLFGLLAVVLVLGIAVTLTTSETAHRRHGALASLIPQVSVPPAARREYVAALPVVLGGWMFFGLFIGLVPLVLRDSFGIDSSITAGLIVALAPILAVVTALLTNGTELGARRASLAGATLVLIGSVVVVIALAIDGLALLSIGAVIGGGGIGISVSGVLRAISPRTRQTQRASVYASIFTAAALGFGVPVVIAGLLAPLGLSATVIGFAALIAVVSLIGLVLQNRAAGRSVRGYLLGGPSRAVAQTSTTP